MTEQNLSRVNVALLVLRVAFSAIMLAHGIQKVFGFGFAGVSGSFAKMGVPAPALMGPFIGILEVVAPIGIIIGLLTRLAALGLALDMLGAMALVHFKNGFFLPTGYEFVLALFVAFVTLAISGAGDYSVDAAIARRKSAA